ncbi:MAG: hypothetical protein K8R92_08765 [Planctomycetes bacterium]|nr:hypothetical protein [Planctomycetota bacterium]
MIFRNLSVLALCGGLAASAQAEVLYSTGFEAPDYSLGSIDGQDGWHLWEAAPIIQNATVHSGNQAVQINQRGEAIHDTYVPASGRVFSLKCDFMHSGAQSNQSDIYFGGDTGFIAQLTSTSRSIGMSRYMIVNTDTWNDDAGVDLADDQWHQLNLILDIDAQSIRGFADGHYLGSIAINTVPFPTAITLFGIDQYIPDYSEGEVSISYFDNLTFEVVPAPGAGLILGLAGALAGRRRR